MLEIQRKPQYKSILQTNNADKPLKSKNWKLKLFQCVPLKKDELVLKTTVR